MRGESLEHMVSRPRTGAHAQRAVIQNLSRKPIGKRLLHADPERAGTSQFGERITKASRDEWDEVSSQDALRVRHLELAKRAVELDPLEPNQQVSRIGIRRLKELVATIAIERDACPSTRC